MKKLLAITFAFVMILSTVFISGAISSTDNSFSAKAQTVRSKRKRKGVARRTYAGGRYVTRKVWNGSKYVTRKVWVASKTGTRKAYRGTKKGVKAGYRKTKNVVY